MFGFFLGVSLVRRFRSKFLLRSPVSIAFVSVLIVAAIISNSNQILYEVGLSLRSIAFLKIPIDGIVGLCIPCLWQMSEKLWFRGMVGILVLATFIQPLLWTFAYATWTIGGFAP